MLNRKGLQVSAKLTAMSLGRCVQTLIECRRGKDASKDLLRAEEHEWLGGLLARPVLVARRGARTGPSREAVPEG